LISFVDFLQFFFGSLSQSGIVLEPVRVPNLHEMPVGHLDIIERGPRFHSEDFIVLIQIFTHD
jgi:hypothetical protein